MNEDRVRHVLDRLAANGRDPDVSVGDAICATAVEVVDVDGAGISVNGPGRPPYSLAVAGDEMAHIHELERTLGEGPCVDAYRTGLPTADPDLDAGQAWPAFRSEVLRTRARAVFGYPLLLAGGCVGALNLYTRRTGMLREDQHRDALVIADLSIHAVLASLEVAPTSPTDDVEIADILLEQDRVYQATGMLSVQLRIPILDALARLRAHAFAEGRTISDVATDVVEGRLRFEG